MKITIVRGRLGNIAVKAGEVSLEGNSVRISTDSKVLMKLIKQILPIPTKLKERHGNKVIKRWPRNDEQNIVATLKQNLYDPYRLARDKELLENSFRSNYEELVSTNILNGEERHELAARKAG